MASLPPLSRSFSSDFHAVQEGFRNFRRRSIGAYPLNDRTKLSRRLRLSREADEHGTKTESFHKNGMFEMIDGYQQTRRLEPKPLSISHTTLYASESGFIGDHQRSSETYLKKIQSETEEISSNSESDINELEDDGSSEARKGLGSLERYLSEVEKDTMSGTSTSDRNTLDVTEDSPTGDKEGGQAKIRNRISSPKYKRTYIFAKKSASSFLYDDKECSNLYLISMLLAVNIAVFLFEIASPIKSSDYDLYSLPLMYGAKVNDLIMVGEWWRLVTPMFLHSGFFHIALSSWVLLSFGPQVCKGYGSFTFLLIYLLGGISGNFTSFLHTAEPTVGGSGPVFAIIGAWFIYQVQNKDATEKETLETMYEKAIIATTLSFVLGNFGPIDNWTNLGAAVSGIIYGYFTCPAMQVDDASSSGIQEKLKDEITLTRRPANPWKSLIIFTVFLTVMTSLLFIMESPLDKLELEELVQIIE